MPTIKEGKRRAIDIPKLNEILCKDSIIQYHTVVVEDPGHHAPSAAGLRSMTYSYATILTILRVHQIRHHTVSARTWQKHFWTKQPGEYDTKAEALKAATKIFPDQSWLKNSRCSKPHDGFVDAALIAEYGRSQNI